MLKNTSGKVHNELGKTLHISFLTDFRNNIKYRLTYRDITRNKRPKSFGADACCVLPLYWPYGSPPCH
jgi:hypothetical protein